MKAEVVSAIASPPGRSGAVYLAVQIAGCGMVSVQSSALWASATVSRFTSRAGGEKVAGKRPPPPVAGSQHPGANEAAKKWRPCRGHRSARIGCRIQRGDGLLAR